MRPLVMLLSLVPPKNILISLSTYSFAAGYVGINPDLTAIALLFSFATTLLSLWSLCQTSSWDFTRVWPIAVFVFFTGISYFSLSKGKSLFDSNGCPTDSHLDSTSKLLLFLNNELLKSFKLPGFVVDSIDSIYCILLATTVSLFNDALLIFLS